MSIATRIAAVAPRWRSIASEVLAWTHNTLMMVGFFVVAAGLYLYAQPRALTTLEHGVSQWEAARKAALDELRALGQPQAAEAATPPAPAGAGPALTHAQLAVADWLSRRYNIAPLAMRQLVSSAWQVGRQEHLEPTLILAVMAVESSFNPYAQSAVGATGLMQVMAKIHSDKFAPYGGTDASIDPDANVRVGALVLKDAIARGGSLKAGLRMYVGASSSATEGGYATKVLSEQARLLSVAAGGHVPLNTPMTAAAPSSASPRQSRQSAA